MVRARILDALPERVFTGSTRAARLGLAMVVVVALAAWCGWTLGAAMRGDRPSPTGSQIVAVGQVRVQVSDTWSRDSAGLNLPALVGPDSRAFAPFPGLAARVLFTLTPATRPSLLPVGLEENLQSAPGPPGNATVANRRAWVYRSLATGVRDRRVDFYALPTTAGVLGIACVAPAASFGVVADCAELVEGVAVPGGRILAPTRKLVFLRNLPGVLARLDRSRTHGRRALRAAMRRRGQAAAAGSLSDAHRRALSTLAPIAAGPAPVAITRALRATALGYGNLKAAAFGGWPRRYARALSEVTRAERRLDGLLAALQAPPS